MSRHRLIDKILVSYFNIGWESNLHASVAEINWSNFEVLRHDWS